MSITSTCFALQAILAGNNGAYDALLTDGNISIPSLLLALLHSVWREEDLFQVPLLLATVLQLDKDRTLLLQQSSNEENEHAAQVRRLIEAVLHARPQRRQGISQTFSDYILYLCSTAYAELNTKCGYGSTTNLAGLPCEALPPDAARQVALSLARCVEVSFNELCRQLAVRLADDKTSFDIMRLAYSLLTYITATESILTGATQINFQTDEELNDSDSLRPILRPVNPKLVRAALKAFFEEQRDDGLWDKGQPIYKSFRKQGRNVGNAFVFSVDTLGSLMERIPAEEFRPYLPQLEKTLTWIEQHQTVEYAMATVEPDESSYHVGSVDGKPLRGWASPHLSPDMSPQAWSTAQTLTCVSRMRKHIRAIMNTANLHRFNGVAYSAEGPVDTFWDRLLDSDLGNCGSDRCRTLKEVLEERMIVPFQTSVSNPSIGAAYSAILFGPPGTAKTTICESLARKLGWDFVVIDTAVFLADGLSNVAARIRYVFERLQVLDKCVILFDEIEEFCLDRETPGLGMESRMLTTAMLTAINDLRRAKRSIFFLATNRLRAFDAAITRPGRFDMQLFTGTPNQAARRIQFEQQLASIPSVQVSDAVKEAALEAYDAFLDSVWTETAMFMNYLEGVQFAKSCANIVATSSGWTHQPLTVEAMKSLLQTQAAVMTVRGTTREEFLASMELSRL